MTLYPYIATPAIFINLECLEVSEDYKRVIMQELECSEGDRRFNDNHLAILLRIAGVLGQRYLCAGVHLV